MEEKWSPPLNEGGGNRPANSARAAIVAESNRPNASNFLAPGVPRPVCPLSFLCFSVWRGCGRRSAATGVRGDIRRNAEGARDGGTEGGGEKGGSREQGQREFLLFIYELFYSTC